MTNTMRQREAFRFGFDHGNFSAAYRNVRWASEALIVEREAYLAPRPFDERPYWTAGFVLGVYSTFELDEVPEVELELLLSAIHFAVERGLPEYRDISEAEKQAAANANPGNLYVPED